MFISDRMSRTMLTITEDDSIRQAAERMAQHRVHQLPVVRGQDRLIGIVTDRDIRSVPEQDRATPVGGIMTSNPITVSPGDPLEDALLLLHRHRFGSLPVVTPPKAGGAGDEALPRLVGIITHTDILAALIDMLGIEEPGTRLEIDLPETRPTSICDALHAITKSGARIISLIVSGDRARKRSRLYVRLSTIDPRPALDALQEAGFRMVDPYCAVI